MITKFEVGHHYRWIGPQVVPASWVTNMHDVFDGKPRLCKYAGETPDFAHLEGINGGAWHWHTGLEGFEDVDVIVGASRRATILRGLSLE